MKNFLLLTLLFIVLTACGPSHEVTAGQTAIAGTNVASNWTKTPTATLTPTATITPTPVPPKIIVLDSFFYDTADESAASKVVLQYGKTYWIILSGTFSVWYSGQWALGMCWGTSEPRPMFPSLNKSNGRVGEDPFYAFGHPNQGGGCVNGKLVNASAGLSKIMLSVDEENFFIVNPTVNGYREDHTYLFSRVGQGHPLAIKLDDTPLSDNYGQIFVVVEQIN